MLTDFSADYSQRSDDELLHVATQRHSLTTEAVAALDAELRRRNLTESDRVEHQRFVKRQEQRDSRKHRRKTFGTLKDRLAWVDVLSAFGVIALISFIYLALPSRYHMTPDWQDAAFLVMLPSVLIVVASRSVFWRKLAFWISLGISSAIHLYVVHVWTKRVPVLSRSHGKGAAFLGFVLFFAVYGVVRLLRRIFYGKETPDNASVRILE
jgi:hypothetical protein